MRQNLRDMYATPEQTYYSVQGLLNVEGDQDDQNAQILQQAVGVSFNYLTQKKIQWSIYLQKLALLFLDLAFKTQKHTKIKQVLKSYRSITQNQHPDSLKSILEYYRDIKLQAILDEKIPKDNIDFIRNMRNIQDDQASSEIIISSFNPEVKNKKQQIRVNLKIIWEGYKAIVDTVRFNQKLQSVYKSTLKKIFEFVDIFNRKHQFKSFCQYLRSGLRNVLNKRGDKTEQQKGFYIDIQKEEVNTNNIQIRLQQFDLTTKLGLWQQAFQLLQDIKQIMRVRKGPVKNSLKYVYFEKLALIFKKSNYWHYHAFAFYNYYSILLTKTKLPVGQKTKAADKLILSVLCIPPSTMQSNQSKESQQKIATMMLSSNKIPSKRQLQQMMISRGVVESASPSIKQLWYFMFLDFDLSSLSKGLKLLYTIKQQGEYQEFIDLLEDILIYKQLISVSEVYQRIKYQSLMSIIPLPKQKIQKVLLECHHKKVIDFVLDQKQGIVIFQDQLEETNPYQEFLSCYVDVALLHQENRKYDRSFILKKTINFIQNPSDYYDNYLKIKIDQYKKKLRRPKQQLEQRQRQSQRKLQQQKRNQQIQRKLRQAQEKKQNQQKLKQFIDKKIRISQIIKIKQNRNVTIKRQLPDGKVINVKIENLTDDQIKQMKKYVFENKLQQVTEIVASQTQNKNKKRFLRIDYFERERRFQLKDIIQKVITQAQNNKQKADKIRQISKADYEERMKLKDQIQKIAPEVKTKIDGHYMANKQKYEQNMIKFKENVTAQFKKKILAKAREMYQEAQKKREQAQQKRKIEQFSQSNDSWTFGGVSRVGDNAGVGRPVATEASEWKRKEKTDTTVQQPKKQYQSGQKKDNKNDQWIKKGPTSGITTTNAFADLKVDDQEKKQKKWNIGGAKTEKVEQNGQQKKQQKKQEGGWLGKNKQATDTQPTTTEQPKKQEKKFVPPTVQEPKGAWGRGKTTTTAPDVNANTNNANQPQNQPAGQRRQQPQLVFKGQGQGAKKDDKKPKGKGW